MRPHARRVDRDHPLGVIVAARRRPRNARPRSHRSTRSGGRRRPSATTHAPQGTPRHGAPVRVRHKMAFTTRTRPTTSGPVTSAAANAVGASRSSASAARTATIVSSAFRAESSGDAQSRAAPADPTGPTRPSALAPRSRSLGWSPLQWCARGRRPDATAGTHGDLWDGLDAYGNRDLMRHQGQHVGEAAAGQPVTRHRGHPTPMVRSAGEG